MLSRFGNHKALHLDTPAFAIQQQGNNFRRGVCAGLESWRPGRKCTDFGGPKLPTRRRARDRSGWSLTRSTKVNSPRVVQGSFMKLLRFWERVPPLSPPRTYVVAKSRIFFRAFHSSHPNFLSPTDMETINTTERLAQLRQLMKDRKVDIYSTK